MKEGKVRHCCNLISSNVAKWHYSDLPSLGPIEVPSENEGVEVNLLLSNALLLQIAAGALGDWFIE